MLRKNIQDNFKKSSKHSMRKQKYRAKIGIKNYKECVNIRLRKKFLLQRLNQQCQINNEKHLRTKKYKKKILP